MNGQDLSASKGPERDEIGSITLTWSTCSRKQTICRKYVKMPPPPSNEMLISDKLRLYFGGRLSIEYSPSFQPHKSYQIIWGWGNISIIITILQKSGAWWVGRGAPPHLSSSLEAHMGCYRQTESCNEIG